MYDGNHWMWGMHWGWWLFGIALVLSLLLLFWRGLWNRDTSASKETPFEILKRRYANGEISTEEYEERKSRLSDVP